MKYAKYLSVAMTERLQTLEASCLGAITLRDELAIVQSFLTDQLIKLDQATQAYAACEDDKQKGVLSKLVDLRQEAVTEKIMVVERIALSASKLEYDERTIGVGIVHGMLAQLCQFIDEELRMNEGVPISSRRIAERIASRAQTELLTIDSLASVYHDTSAGSLAPANLEAALMDDTVPAQEVA